MTRPFCASCLAEAPDLVLDESYAKPVLICRRCRAGDLRTGRWRFTDGHDSGARDRTTKKGGAA